MYQPERPQHCRYLLLSQRATKELLMNWRINIVLYLDKVLNIKTQLQMFNIFAAGR